MSDISKSPGPGAATEAPKFTERELQLLGWAMQSLKSGPPEIDYEKLAAFAGMTNPRSAGNAWAALKKKLMVPTDGSVVLTPKKAGGRKKKVDVGEDGESTPKKSARKRANKDSEDGDSSPTKKPRTIKAKPKEEESTVKAERDSVDELQPKVDAGMAEIEEEV